MSINIVNVSSGSSGLQAQTIDSSTHPETIASSLPDFAVPVIDLAAQDSREQSVHTVEYIASSPRPASTVSSEELDVDIARARAMELQLASEEAEQARRAAAAKREAAAAQRRLLEAQARSSRTSRATGSSRNERGRPAAIGPAEGGDEIRRQNVRSAHELHPVGLDRRGTVGGHDHGHIPPHLPERSRPIPGAGILDFLFSDAEVVADAVQEHRRQGDVHHQVSHQRQEGSHSREHHRPNSDIDEQLRALHRRIAELEAEKGQSSSKGESSSGARPPASSGFQTPRTIIDAPLIDLSSPPKTQHNRESAEDSLMDLPVPRYPNVENPDGPHDRRAGDEGEGRHLPQLQGERHRGRGDETRASPTIHHTRRHPDPVKQGRLDIHPLMMGPSMDANAGGASPDPPPGLANFHDDKIKLKEADEVKIPALPEMAKFVAWKQQVRDNIMSASGRGRDILPWILDIEKPEVPYDALADTAGLGSLDVKLSAAINRVKRGRIERILTNLDETAAARGTFISGRQKLRMIYEQFELDKAKGQLYDMRNLNALEYPGDDRLEAFLDTWDEIVNRLSHHPGDQALQEILSPLLDESTVLRGVMDIYHLADPGTPQRSYDFLHRALTLHVDRRRQKKNRDDMVEAMFRSIKGKAKPTLPVKEEADEEEKPAAPAKEKKGERGQCYAHLRGSCTRGDKCRFSHEGKPGSLPPMSEQEKRELADKRSQIPCKLYARGLCKFGDKCQYKHDARADATAAACIEDEDTASQGSGEEGEVVFSCPAAEGGTVREWIVDTGTENHLVTTSKVDSNDANIFEAERPLRLATANGTITASRRVRKSVPELGIDIDPLMLDKTVDAISVGRLVMDQSFSFYWPSGQDAYFTDKDGRIIQCGTRGYVPVITAESDGVATAPGIAAQVQTDENAPVDDEAISRDEALQKDALSPEHCLTHLPKNPYCWVCGMSKMVAKQARRLGPGERAVQPTTFAEHVCADHVTGMDEQRETVDGDHAALFIMDLHTRFPCLAPVKDKSAESAIKALKYYVGDRKIVTMYSDNSKELGVAGKQVSELHVTSTPYRPQSNSIAERGIRTLLEATRAALVQAGMPCRFWPMAGAHQSFALAVSRQLNGDPSPYEKLHGEEFAGWRLPFGSLVHYRPPRPVMKSLPKFAPRTVPGVFVGWHLDPGCSWRGDYLVIPLTSFQQSGRKSYQAHRIKELISFDPTDFPLQATYLENLKKVDPVPTAGDKEWPDQVDDERDEEPARPTSSTLDEHYREVFGHDAPADLSFDEKYRLVMLEMFGSDDEDEGTKLAIADGDEAQRKAEDKEAWLFGSDDDDGPKEPAHADGSDGQGEDIPGPDSEKKVITSRAPRAKRLFIPKMAMIARSELAMVARSAEPPSPAPRRKITEISDRRLIEYCCAENSLLGDTMFAGIGCAVTRLTIANDLTTKAGLDYALQAIEDTPADHYLHLWGSLPCTAGSPWQRINRRRSPHVEKRIAELKVTMSYLLENFITVAEKIIERGGDISFEWPSSCELWNEPAVESMIHKFSLNKVKMHGCAAGLISARTGLPVKKPWTIATSSPRVAEELGKFQCPGHEVHEPCAGAETKRTEAYTPEMAQAVHRAIRDQAVGYRARVALAAMTPVDWEHDDAIHDLEQIPEPTGHREKCGRPGLWCAMVTRTLHPSDPMSRHPGALAAIQDELKDLRSHPAWDEAHPIEAAELARTDPDAHVARVFPIVGIKHWEDPASHVWKGRIVLAGNNIKTATGQWALFQDLGAVPSTMAACRAILAAYAVTKDAQLFQSDCVKAYVQAELKGTPTYVRLPKAWWPPQWVGRYRDPLCRLLRALYGHPDAGNQWADKIGDELRALGFVEPEGWTATFVLHADVTHVVVFVLYVDDLIMFGTSRVNEIIEKVRANIKMDDPSDLQKYLGVVHHIVRKEVGGETITYIEFDMAQFFKSAVDDYVQLSGATLTKAASPFAPRLDHDVLDKLISEKGEMAEHAAHCLMKLMYGARMALPYLCVVISRLSSQISRWTRESDRRLHRVYCYLQHALDIKLRGSLSTGDFENMKIVAWPDADLSGDPMDTKSTSGYFMELVGSDGRGMPLSWGAKKQGCTAVHTAEAEVVSLATCVRNEVLPMQSLLELIFRKPVDCEIMEDNAAAIIAITKGYSPTMRYLPRTQRVSLGMLSEIFSKEPEDNEGRVRLVKADTNEHRGDAFTKELESHKFARALELIRMSR